MTAYKFIQFAGAFMLLLLLAAMRFYEQALFNDPLHIYFHSDFQNLQVPRDAVFRILAITSLRFLVSSAISVVILHLVFNKMQLLKASLWVYLFSFMILMLGFTLALTVDFSFSKTMLFYCRRFLIHPLLLFIMLAGFYYLKDKELR